MAPFGKNRKNSGQNLATGACEANRIQPPGNLPWLADSQPVRDRSLVHPALEVPNGRAVLGQHGHRAAPARQAVAVDAAEQALRERLEEVVGLEAGRVHTLAQAVECFGAVARDDEVVGEDLGRRQGRWARQLGKTGGRPSLPMGRRGGEG